MKGNKLCLCFLLAAGVGLGAHAQNKIAAPMKDVNQVVDNTLDSLNVARSARPVSGSSRKGDNPGVVPCWKFNDAYRYFGQWK